MPLFLLVGCSNQTLSNNDVTSSLDLIQFAQNDINFSLPKKVSIVITFQNHEDYISLNEPTYTSSLETINFVYDEDNHYFHFSKTSTLDPSINSEFYYYLKGMDLYEVRSEGNINKYKIINNKSFNDMLAMIDEKVNESGFKDLLLGKKAIDEIHDMLEESLVGVDEYKEQLDEDTQVKKYSFVFSGNENGNLNSKKEILLTTIINEDDGKLLKKDYEYHVVQFENNILVKDYLVVDEYYRFKMGDDIIRYENKEDVFSLNCTFSANIFYPNLVSYTQVD